ncbi:hypothetical protein [Sphingobium lignivorans]|uniref:Uncharacterized protein n=1 Tax=Sphingobium lignivorans TaxID=2735886 RepID=A0ABR6NDL5_9SPHN|nr:hypothetical protein [Sphingobium lignivorans]MBB5985370.1 hypothetical protein [Sphingobium lignivorans]
MNDVIPDSIRDPAALNIAGPAGLKKRRSGIPEQVRDDERKWPKNSLLVPSKSGELVHAA